MERDWELIRAILFRLEQHSSPVDVLRPEHMPPHTPDKVAYHIKIMMQAGLIDGECSKTIGGAYCMASSLTWNGQEFLATIRDETAWNQARKHIRQAGITITFEAIKLAMQSITKNLLG